MLKILIKKEFLQCFRGYFVDNKTGKAKSKGKIISSFILFGFLMLFLASAFVAMGFNMEVILYTDFKWLYYTLFGIITISLGTFASVFNTANSLYNSKDNNLLLSMPIKPSYVLLSRVSMVYGLCLLYSAIVWLPGSIFGLIRTGFNFGILIIDILLLFVTTLFSSVLSCAIGYIVAAITNKTKNKSIVSVVISGMFLVVYYIVCFRFSNIMDSIVTNGEEVANGIFTWGNFVYHLGNAACGNILSFILYSLICIALGIICYVVLARSFSKIIANANIVTVTKTKVTYKSSKKITNVLLRKEFKRFTSSATYMLNSGLGVLFVLGIAVAALIKAKDILPLLEMIKDEIPELYQFLPLGVVGIVCMIISINAIAVPSVSLEGNSLWILKSLPVKTHEILDAKKTLQIIVNGIPTIISIALICYALKLDFSLSVSAVCIAILFVEVQSSICVLLSLVNPNFNWTSETQPIKQSVSILLEMVISFVVVIAVSGLYYFVRNMMEVSEYMNYALIVLMVVEVLLRKLIRTWGVNKFEAL